jgi:hypothetical protein
MIVNNLLAIISIIFQLIEGLKITAIPNMNRWKNRDRSFAAAAEAMR